MGLACAMLAALLKKARGGFAVVLEARPPQKYPDC
jgi:hypothetical protein